MIKPVLLLISAALLCTLLAVQAQAVMTQPPMTALSHAF